MATLRIGIVGAGWIGRHHAAHWMNLPVRLAGFLDTVHSKAAEAAVRFGGSAFRSLDELLAAVDVVQVCTPTPFHKAQVLAAVDAGKFVFCEKPLARTVADAQEMVQVCERIGARLFVGQVLRFFPQYVRTRRAILDGVMGRPLVMRLVRGAGHPTVSEDRSWFTVLEQSGGAIMEGGVHDLDFARWCFGEVERVFARGITLRDDLAEGSGGAVPGDHVFAMLHFENGMVGHVEESWMVTDGRFRQQIEVVGDRGCLMYDSQPLESFAATFRRDARKVLLPGDPLVLRDDPYFLQLEHFHRCLRDDQPFLVTPHDGLEAVRLANACLESLRSGQIVRVREVQ